MARPRKTETVGTSSTTDKITKTEMTDAIEYSVPATPVNGDKYYDNKKEITLIYSEKFKRWNKWNTNIREPIEIVERNNMIAEIFTANSWVDGKRISSSEFELELSKFLEKIKLKIEADNNILKITVIK